MKRDYKFIIIVGLLFVIIGLLFFKKDNTAVHDAADKQAYETEKGLDVVVQKRGEGEYKNTQNPDIASLTDERTVIAHVKLHGSLPDYYLTKKEARSKGWVASQGNLCDVLPGCAIGGDVFSNRQKILPAKKGRIWYEADLNYDCGRRNADRVVFSNDGLVYVTYDHYKTFREK